MVGLGCSAPSAVVFSSWNGNFRPLGTGWFEPRLVLPETSAEKHYKQRERILKGFRIREVSVQYELKVKFITTLE
jgi:hypothetical protein